MEFVRNRRLSACAIGTVVLASCGLAVGPAALGAQAEPRAASAIAAEQFAQPAIDFRPGVRWWWPGNAASQEDLLAQVDYLHDNGFGAVEIVAFAKDFLTGDGTTTGTIYDGADLGYDLDSILSYESPEYFAKLDAVIARANELGITVDLNMGSGYLANDDSVSLEDSQPTLALGRSTVRVADDGSVSVVAGGIAANRDGATLTLGIPGPEASPLFASEKFGFNFGEWDPAGIRLTAVMLAPVVGQGEALDNANQTLTTDLSEVKTYASQPVLDLDAARLSYPASGDTTFAVEGDALAAGDYEVIALYDAPTGAYGLNSIVENTTTGERNRVVDHMDPNAIANFVNGWLGEAALKDIVDTRDVRAAFNDSYEFYTDTHYNELIQAAAQSTDLLGYDITPYFPSLYAIYKDAFLIQGTPTVKQEYADLGMTTPQVSAFGGGAAPLIVSDLSEEESARIVYDYGRLVNAALLDGLSAFSSTLDDYGIEYRQQAYNPPIDTLRAAEYVDIPETEGLDEYSLKRVSSGAHLYGRDLVTSEVYTLGSVPFKITPDFVKKGYDLMATSGVNNFFYHGLSATYHGNTDPSFTSDDDLFPEEGWRAWPSIGIEMADTSGVADYYASMNDYASRTNYLMQSGENSSDIAVYMPLFGSLASGGGFGGGSSPLQAITLAQREGWTWDAINDDTIQTGLTWTDGRLVANDGNAAFDALVVESATVPVETMTALRRLQEQGAPIVILGAAPATQPGYAGGDYADLDAQVADLAALMGGGTDADTARTLLDDAVSAPISYSANDDVRFARRTLETGGELAFVRSTNPDAPVGVTMEVAGDLTSCWWLDPESGRIHAASLTDGTVSATFAPAGAAALLCEPEGIGFAAPAVTAGLPHSLDATERPVVNALGEFTLEVTADNIGTNVPGASATETWTGAVLGDWSTDAVDGRLRYVADAGTYRTTATIADASDLTEGGAVLDLGAVNSAATVRVNPGTDHEWETQLYAAPFTVDIAPALVDGVNVIEIEVQPVQSNRREGLKELYLSDPVANVRYQAYNSQQGGQGLVPAGLVGPVELRSAVESVAEPTPSETPAPGESAQPSPVPSSTETSGPVQPGAPEAGAPDDDLARTGIDGGLVSIIALGGALLLGTGVTVAVLRRRRRLSE